MRIIGLAAMNDTTPLRDAIEAYARSLQASGKATKTIFWYFANLLRFCEWLQACRQPGLLADLRFEIVEEYLAYRRGMGRRAATCRGDAMSLKAFASWLAKRSYPSVGCQSILRDFNAGPTREKDRRDKEPLTDEELQLLLSHFNPDAFLGLRDGAFIRLLVDCGCRLGEALSARERDIFWPRNELVVTGKTGTRSVKFSADTATWLDRYVKLRRRVARDGVDNLVVTNEGMPLTENGSHSLFVRLRRSVGIRRLHPHLLRHTWASDFRRYGCGDLLDLQERGGWSDLAMVRRYAHIRPEAERAAEQAPLDRMGTANTHSTTANSRLNKQLNQLFSKNRKFVA